MKKIIVFIAALTAMMSSIYGQNADLQKWINKSRSSGNDIYQIEKPKSVSKTNDYYLLMEKSTKFQCGALTFAGIGAGLSIAGAIIGTKDYQDVPLEEQEDKIKSDRKTRKSLFIGAGIGFAAALCLEMVALDYKLKAGRSIKLYTNGTGGGLAYTF